MVAGISARQIAKLVIRDADHRESCILHQTVFVKRMVCHQSRTIRRPRRRKPATTTTTMVVVGAIQTKINKVCTFFRRNACTKGNKYKWLHPQGEQGKTRTMSLGNEQFEREVGQSFVRHALKSKLGPPLESRKRKRDESEEESSDDELTYKIDGGEEPVSSRKCLYRRTSSKKKC